eukprot:1022725-Amphidinium_carterae.1
MPGCQRCSTHCHSVRLEDLAALRANGEFAHYRDLHGARGPAGADMGERMAPSLVRGCASLYAANTAE